MENIDFSIERGFRSFEYDDNYKNLIFYNFYVIQISLSKSTFIDGVYNFELINNKNNELIFKRTIDVNSNKKIVITPGSHEDPLIESNTHIMLCFQLWDNDIKNIMNQLEKKTFPNSFLSNDVSVVLKKDNKIIKNINIDNLYKYFEHDFIKRSSIINDYFITSTEDCIFRIHLGYEDGNYEEIEHFLKKGEKFDFSQYLINPYVGLQCSYEYENIEVEEKHIVIGLKSMTLSGVYDDGIEKHYALLPFESKYQILFSPKEYINTNNNYAFIKKEQWNEVNNIKDLIRFYKDKEIKFFESSFDFLESQYRNKSTYGLNKVFSTIKHNNNNKKHIDLEVCKGCEKKTKCIQIVPSNLSYQLFKENLYINSKKGCIIYKELL